MINELEEVEAYLRGENIDSNGCTFRMCYLMAKYFSMQGLTPLGIREAIFKWGKDNGVYILHNVNDIIRMAVADTTPLVDFDVYVNDDDIYEIDRRFSTGRMKLCALAILVYAKAHTSDETNDFTFNQIDFAKWLSLKQPNLSMYFGELEDMSFMTRIRRENDNLFAWNGIVVGKRVRYRLAFPVKNEGQYKIEGNDIEKLYNEIFCPKKPAKGI